MSNLIKVWPKCHYLFRLTYFGEKHSINEFNFTRFLDLWIAVIMLYFK